MSTQTRKARVVFPHKLLILSIVFFGLCLFFLLLPNRVSTQATETCVPPPPGIIAWWPFDETSGTTAEEVIGGRNGVHINGPEPTAGKVGGALRFDGTSSYVGAPDSDLWAFGTGNFTVELWANFDAPTSGDIVHPGDVFISSDDGPGTQNKWIFALGGGLLELIVANTADVPPNFFLVRAPFSPVVGEWYHLAVTKTATLFTIYVNGVEVGSEVSTPPIANANAPLIIGQSNEPFGGFMNGLLDEVTIYNRALTQQELKAIFDAGSVGKCKALSISTKALSATQMGTFSTQQLEARFGSAPFIWSVVKGDLPSGMTLDSGGVLSGTPTAAGSFPVTIRVTDSLNAIAEKNFFFDVLLTLLPPDIRIHKTGTVVVPGRIVDYFVLVENKGQAVATNVEVVEILEPPAFFSLVSTTPTAQVSEESLVYWEIPSLQPDETKLFSYSVRLNPSVPLGTIVSGQACAKETGKSSEQILQRIPKCTLLPQCAILFDKNAGELALCNVAKETCEACDKFCTTIAGIKFCLPPLYGACLAECALKVSICVQALMDCQPACFPAKCPSEAQTVLAANGLQCAECPFGCSCDDRPARGAVDPNEKAIIAKKFIQPDQLLVYPIHFENIGDVEARDVFVTDALDPNLDTSTLNLLTPTGGSFDVTTRTVRWDLLNTNLPPGETGNVLLSIRPRPGLPSGTVIRNSATIQFEVFQPIITNEVVNIIDSTRPTSVVNPLPAETSALDFPISWSGSDAIGQIDFYSILVSVDGGNFAPFLERTRETTAMFRGEAGRTYEFIAIATDTAGNIEVQSATAEASTRVVANCTTGGDHEPSTITAPPAVTLNTRVDATSCGVTVNNLDTTLGVASAKDNCPGVTIARSGVPDCDFFPVGQTTLTYTATDTSGNTAMATQVVTVIDNAPPTIAAESVNPDSLWPPNHKMSVVTINYNAADNCGPPTCTLSVTSNEPVNGTGNGDTGPDWAVVDAHHVRLRAERAGTGRGRFYTITITCTDSSGNSTSRDVAVFVAHNIIGPASGMVFKIGPAVNFTGTFWDLWLRPKAVKW